MHRGHGAVACTPMRLLSALRVGLCIWVGVAVSDGSDHAVRPALFPTWASDVAEQLGCFRPLQESLAEPPLLPGELLAKLKASARYGIALYSVFLAEDGEHDDDQEQLEFFHIKGSVSASWIARMVAQGIRPVVLVSNAANAELYERAGAFAFYSKAFLKEMDVFLQGEVSDSNVFRWAVAEQLVRAGLDAIYFDLDTIWFGDLREAYANSDEDVVFQSQAFSAVEETVFHEPDMKEARARATAEEGHVCCSISFAHICTGVMLFRATAEVQALAARVRARAFAGPCENMQTSVMELFHSCAPRGPVRCGVFTPRGAMTWSRFVNEVMRKTQQSDPGGCGMRKTGRACSEEVLRQNGPLLVHLDSSHDKHKPTNLVNDMWPLRLAEVEAVGRAQSSEL